MNKTLYSYKGNVVKTRFIASKELYYAFQEETFKKLYNACRAIKIDLSKMKGESSFDANNFVVWGWRAARQ